MTTTDATPLTDTILAFPHDAGVRVIQYASTGTFNVEVLCAGLPRHGSNWVYFNSFSTMTDAMAWASIPANVA